MTQTVSLTRMAILLILLWGLSLFAADPTLVYLVRHAEKVDSSKDADLSATGMARAEALRAFFEKIEINHVISTEYQRTRKTVAPTAASKKLEVETVPAGNPQRLIDMIRKNSGKVFLAAGHSNTVPDLIKRLGAGDLEIAYEDYDNVFLVILSGDKASLQQFRFQSWSSR